MWVPAAKKQLYESTKRRVGRVKRQAQGMVLLDLDLKNMRIFIYKLGQNWDVKD